MSRAMHRTAAMLTVTAMMVASLSLGICVVPCDSSVFDQPKLGSVVVVAAAASSSVVLVVRVAGF